MVDAKIPVATALLARITLFSLKAKLNMDPEYGF